ncbi:hypothetical protein IHE44_0013577 [Lamprotornis superbus]|uniref:Uncharacterized protein n=1 Tax=Lamprotornis superbus TaxID=245042 RepID=A0A835NT00_9PASS|nr:hypothetical protein IHE44_0013577 [Lamprotornis superbus]
MLQQDPALLTLLFYRRVLEKTSCRVSQTSQLPVPCLPQKSGISRCVVTLLQHPFAREAQNSDLRQIKESPCTDGSFQIPAAIVQDKGMGKAGIKRCKWDSKGGVTAQHNSSNWQIKVCQFHPEVNFWKTDSWDRAFSRANSTGESTDLPAAKEMQLWPKISGDTAPAQKVSGKTAFQRNSPIQQNLSKALMPSHNLFHKEEKKAVKEALSRMNTLSAVAWRQEGGSSQGRDQDIQVYPGIQGKGADTERAHWVSQDKQEVHSRGPTQLGRLGTKPEPLPDPTHTRHSLILYLLTHSWWLGFLFVSNSSGKRHFLPTSLAFSRKVCELFSTPLARWDLCFNAELFKILTFRLHALLLGRDVLGVHQQPIVQALRGRALAFEIQRGPLLDSR